MKIATVVIFILFFYFQNFSNKNVNDESPMFPEIEWNGFSLSRNPETTIIAQKDDPICPP